MCRADHVVLLEGPMTVEQTRGPPDSFASPKPITHILAL